VNRAQGIIVSAGCIASGALGYRLAGQDARGGMVASLILSVLANAALAAAIVGRRTAR
jgi:hypothetical protein